MIHCTKVMVIGVVAGSLFACGDSLKPDGESCAKNQDCESGFCFHPENQNGQVQFCATLSTGTNECPGNTKPVSEPGAEKSVCLIRCDKTAAEDPCDSINPELRCVGEFCDAEGWYVR
jgi:hypothetical protein